MGGVDFVLVPASDTERRPVRPQVQRARPRAPQDHPQQRRHQASPCPRAMFSPSCQQQTAAASIASACSASSTSPRAAGGGPWSSLSAITLSSARPLKSLVYLSTLDPTTTILFCPPSSRAEVGRRILDGTQHLELDTLNLGEILLIMKTAAIQSWR